MAQSHFWERFRFARKIGPDETDKAFSKAVGLSSASVSAYKQWESGAPPSDSILAVARRCGVDPGWLAFGDDSAAPSPNGFDVWRSKQEDFEPAPLSKFKPAATKKAASKRARRG